MKKLVFITLLFAVWWIDPVGYEATCCTVCHSKNPKMVRMHDALGLKETECFKCHGQGLVKEPEAQKVQMLGDERCIPCHKK